MFLHQLHSVTTEHPKDQGSRNGDEPNRYYEPYLPLADKVDSKFPTHYDL